MYFIDYIFSEMASQKWIMLFGFLALFTLKVEARTSLSCLVELISQLNQTIARLKNCSCDGKSPICPVKVKPRRRDEQSFHEVLRRKGLLVLDTTLVTPTHIGQIPGTFTPTFTKNPEQNHLPVSNLA